MPPCAIEFGSRFSAEARALSAERRRRLKRDYFECRLGRDVRMVFRLQGSSLKMALIGDHDDVRRFLRSL